MEMVHFIPSSQRRLAMQAAQADLAPVLIHGGKGTGKGAISRWIHANSPRAGRPLLTATFKRSLAEQIPEAQGGTLMIPEMGEWPLAEQKILLGFLTHKTVTRPEDGNLPRLVNARIIATTSQALESRAQGGLFNMELLERLNLFRLEMPRLSDRLEEFEDIVLGIMGEITRELHKDHLKGVTPAAWEKLKSYEWPGNLRELRNVLRMAVLQAQGDQIDAENVPAPDSDRIDFRATREQFEKIYILELLRTFNWEIEKTCQMGRMDKQTLLQKMQQYGIPVTDLTTSRH